MKHIAKPITTATATTTSRLTHARITAEPDILVGVSDFWRFFKGVTEIAPSQYIVQTSIGNVICGQDQLAGMNAKIASSGVLTSVVHSTNAAHMPTSKPVEEFWDLETIGIRDYPAENDDETAMKAFDASICKINGRYRVSWPWKEEFPDRPKVLGIPWNIKDDELQISFPSVPGVTATRRSVLSSLASVFDPLELLTPALVPAKLYFQTQWAEKRGWDEQLSGPVRFYGATPKLHWHGLILKSVATSASPIVELFSI